VWSGARCIFPVAILPRNPANKALINEYQMQLSSSLSLKFMKIKMVAADNKMPQAASTKAEATLMLSTQSQIKVRGRI
jgi:hypothetical protein